MIAAVSQGIRKLFRNRNKSWQDLEDEKEAYRINKTCGSLEEMLLEYLRAAQEGTAVDQEWCPNCETYDPCFTFNP